MEQRRRILVIRLGALGDLTVCMQAFAEIRAAYPQAEIALLTMLAFKSFAKSMPWFDGVLIDPRAPSWRLGAWRRLAASIRHFNPDLIIDLQGKRRQTILYWLLGGPFGPHWSGAAPLCAYPRRWPPVVGEHFTDFLADQLRRADIPAAPPADLSWLDAPLAEFDLPSRFALLIPGCSPTRPTNRWLATGYAQIAERLRRQGISVIALGTAIDSDAIKAVIAAAPGVIDFMGRTSLPQLAALARRAVCIIGNDTGATHLAAASGGRVLALIDGNLNPAWSHPEGAQASYLAAKPLAALSPDEVWLALTPYLRETASPSGG